MTNAFRVKIFADSEFPDDLIELEVFDDTANVSLPGTKRRSLGHLSTTVQAKNNASKNS